MVKTGLTAFAFAMGVSAAALSADQQPWQWQLKPEESSIAWQATQNNAPVKGAFADFTTEITFHPEALAQSKATVTIQTASITTGYDEAQSTLKTKDWFFVDSFPDAIFETQSFEALGDNRYRAASTLTIKDKTVPVTLDFTLHAFNETEAHIMGETTLKRTDFGIGWPDTAQIADEVKVSVEIKASR